MVHLLSVGNTFHARVVAARLGSDGILTELRGAVDGPYPGMGEVGLYVGEGDLPVARELLLADEVESAFEEEADATWRRVPAVPAWMAAVAVFLVANAWLAKAI